MSSTIVVRYNGTDISSGCLFAETTFESQMAAIPGTFRVVVSDPNHTYSFITGKEITLDVDGVRMYGGYLLNVAKEYAFPADKTTNPALTKSRRWVLTGVDYNILFEKRVQYNHTNHIKANAKVGAAGIYDGAVIRTYFTTWFDDLTGFDFTNTTNIKDVYLYSGGYLPMTPGTTMKAELDNMALWGAVYYIDADKKFHWIPIQDTAAPWGFSDKPSLADTPPTIGFRDGEMTEDASSVVNDAFVWGGSEWAGTGTVVYDNKSNSTSITNHGRWQYAEVRVGESDFKNQASVTARAKLIVDGNVVGASPQGTKGLVEPEKQFVGTWFAHDVPSAAHLRPPAVVYINMQVFGFNMSVPLRQVQVSFPGLDATGKAFVQFTGLFGVLMTDPYWLWAYLKKQQGQTVSGLYSGATNATLNPAYGSYYQDVPNQTANGTRTVFTIGNAGGPTFTYIGGTVIAFKNGLALIAGVDYTESDPANGEITFTTAPDSGSTLYITCILAG